MEGIESSSIKRSKSLLHLSRTVSLARKVSKSQIIKQRSQLCFIALMTSFLLLKQAFSFKKCLSRSQTLAVIGNTLSLIGFVAGSLALVKSKALSKRKSAIEICIVACLTIGVGFDVSKIIEQENGTSSGLEGMEFAENLIAYHFIAALLLRNAFAKLLTFYAALLSYGGALCYKLVENDLMMQMGQLLLQTLLLVIAYFIFFREERNFVTQSARRAASVTEHSENEFTWMKTINSLSQSIVVTDYDCKLFYYNPSFSKFFGIGEDEDEGDITGQCPEALSTHIKSVKFRDDIETLFSSKTERDFNNLTVPISKNELSQMELMVSQENERRSYTNLSKALLFLRSLSKRHSPEMIEEKLWKMKESDFFYADATYEGKSIEIGFNYTKYNGNNRIVLVFTDITFRDKIANLEDHSQYKSLLLSSISHEVRTPLCGTTTLLRQAMEEEDMPSSIKESLVRPAILNIKRLLYLLKDITDYSQMNFGQKMKLKVREFNLKSLMNELMKILKYEADLKQICISYKIEQSAPPRISTDIDRLSQVLMNLISNAIKYTFNGKIDILIRKATSSNEIEFAVNDTGIGLNDRSLKKMRRLFSNQYQGKINAESTGIGLGLSMSNAIALKLGAGIKVEASEEGSRFSFSVKDHAVVNSNEWLAQQQHLEIPNSMVLASESSNIRFSHSIEDDNIEEREDNENLDQEQNSERSAHQLPSSHMNTFAKSKPEFMRSTYHTKKHLRLSFASSHSNSLNPKVPAIDNNRTPRIIDFSKASLTLELPSNNLGGEITLSNSGTHLFEGKTLGIVPDCESTLRSDRIKPMESCPSVVIVDDDPFNVQSIEVTLKKQMIKTVAAYNGLEAIKKIEEITLAHRINCSNDCKGIKLVLMDCNMPVLDGYATTRILKKKIKEGDLGSFAIVAATAYTGLTEKTKCKECGMDGFMQKPIKFKNIASYLKD